MAEIGQCNQVTALKPILEWVQAEGRVCPQPLLWNKLWEMLPGRHRVGGGWAPAAPLILAAWWATSDCEKRQRFLEHIQYANEHGVLDEVADYLRALSPDDWHFETKER